jgi:hypothetical protein
MKKQKACKIQKLKNKKGKRRDVLLVLEVFFWLWRNWW